MRPSFYRFLKTFISLPIWVSFIFFTGCNSTKEDSKPLDQYAVEDLYEKAFHTLTEEKDFKRAATLFEEVQRIYPLSIWAVRSELMAAYAYYEAANYTEAVATIDNFIQLHPVHKDLAYAYYLKGMCYYAQINSVNRDQENTMRAFLIFKEILEKFPSSVYAKDVKLKIDLTQEYLAGQDMEIGRFYQQQHYFIAALNRFTNVVKNYQTTSHILEALYRLVEVFLRMGMYEDAIKTVSVLGYNYPGSLWYEKAYKLLERNDLLPQDMVVSHRR